MLFDKLINRRIEEYQNDLMKKYCDEVEEMYTKMRGWRHDYHNHIQALKAGMESREYERVSAYLYELNDDLTNVDTVVKTGRVMVDAILNGKLSIAKKNNIKTNVKVRIPENLSVSDVDMCALIGNLLDNAIEENLKLDEGDRFIRIYTGQKGAHFYMSLTNAAAKKKDRRDGLFPTSKGEGHGFGMSRVRAIAEKYDGIISLDSEDGGFTAELLIPLSM